MYDLYRFFEKQEYVDSFLKGYIHVTSIGHFWENGFTGQKDFTEGLMAVVDASDSAGNSGYDFVSTFGKEHILLPIMHRMEAMKYCHIACFVLHRYDEQNEECELLDSNMRSFGGYAVRIKNLESFVNRIFLKLRNNRDYGLVGPVDYHNIKMQDSYRDCFDKLEIFSHQKEWRFAYLPNYEELKNFSNSNPERSYDHMCDFKIEDIHDIAEQVNVDDVFSNIGSLYRGKNGSYTAVKTLRVPLLEERAMQEQIQNIGIPYSYDANPFQYVGYAPRSAFRAKIMDLCPGYFKPIITIG